MTVRFPKELTRLRRPFATALIVLGSAAAVSAQSRPGPTATIVRAEGEVTLDGRAVEAGSTAIPLGESAEIHTAAGRTVVVLKRGGALVLGPHSSARVHLNRIYNFNRVELLTGSAVLLSGPSTGLLACGTEARLSSGGAFRFDVLERERVDGSQRCRIRVYQGAASAPGASMSYILRDRQEMVLNRRAGDMIPISPLPSEVFDELDTWAREQAGEQSRP